MEKVNAFWLRHPNLDRMAVHERDGEHRCKICGKIFNRLQDFKGHYTRGKGGCPERVRPTRSNNKTQRVVMRLKKAKAQKQLDQVKMGEGPNKWPFENVFDFCYLGHHFVADGDSLHAVEIRLAMASVRFSELRHLWKSSDIPSMIPKRFKLQL